MNVLLKRFGAVIAGVAGTCSFSSRASGQALPVAGACCVSDGSCTVTTPHACTLLGGVYSDNSPCPTPSTPPTLCDPLAPGIAMSRTAARRLLQEGVIHTLWTTGDPLALNNSSATPIADLWNLSANGALIAPHIYLDVREDPDPELAAQKVIDRVTAAKADWDGGAYSTTADFRWALRLDAVGQSTAWHMVPPDALPAFTNHEFDVVPGKLWSDRYIYSDQDWGHIGAMNAVSASATTFTVASSHAAFFAQYDEEYYLEPWPAEVTFDGVPGYKTITGYNQSNQTFTVDSPFSVSITENPRFRMKRGHRDDYKPCYFFKNGSNDLETWMVAFRTYLVAEWAGTGLPDPVAVIVGTEDIGAVIVDWDNYLDYLADPRAATDPAGEEEDEGFTIDGVRNLATWHADFAYRNGNPLDPLFTGEPLTYTPQGSEYGPGNKDIHSYLGATLLTAYNYHREKSTWQHLRAIWPDARLTQYLIGDGYGVTDSEETEPRGVPTGPASSVYHGTPTWQGSVNWDAYGCITNSRIPYDPLGDGRVVPLYQHSAESTSSGTVGFGSTSDEIVVASFGNLHNSTTLFDPASFLTAQTPLFVEFTFGNNIGTTVAVTGWADGALLLPEGLDLLNVPQNGDEFIVYYPTFVAQQYLIGDVPWPLIETFCGYYGEDTDADGFLATGKKWAMEQARAQTLALPENPYTLTFGPGSYDGNQEVVSRWATYPNEPFTSKDGWLDGDDFADIGSQAIDYGVNHFDWYVPGFVDTSGVPHAQLVDHVVTAIGAMHERHQSNRRAYRAVWCLADWNLDNVISFTDQSVFYQDYLDQHPDADLNGDLDFTDEDIDIFHSSDHCGLDHIVDCNANDRDDALDIAEGDADPEDEFPDLDTNDNGIIDLCEPCDADWDGDLEVGVPDIFSFLSDWMADTNGAKCYGGTCGVPAIFAFLSTWFSYGQNPCYE